ncbi:MAG: GNAT family N-acetyltransferase [Planctomycetia bacterium]
MFNSQIEATLGDIYVAADHRAMGIGKRLLDQAIHWAQIMEAHSLRLGVHSANTKAIDFYTDNGFQEKFKWMTLAL